MSHADSTHQRLRQRPRSWSRCGAALLLMSVAPLAACGEPDPARSVIILEPGADACDAVTCDSPPVPSCQGQVSVSYAATGTCQDGACSYAAQRADCAASARRCAAGRCVKAVVQLSAGEHFMCALDQGGSVWCWGSNNRGQLGDGAEGPDHRRGWPLAVVDLSQGVEVRAAGAHTCARRQDGALLCWG